MKIQKDNYDFLKFEKEKEKTYLIFYNKEKKENEKYEVKNIYDFYDDKKNWIFSIVKDTQTPLEPPKLIRTKKGNIKKVIKKSIVKKRKKRN